jgi:hypothetical protein
LTREKKNGRDGAGTGTGTGGYHGLHRAA